MKVLSLLAACAVVMNTATSADALSMSFFAPPSVGSDFTTTLLFPRFDPSLGTLTRVEGAVFATIVGQQLVSNHSTLSAFETITVGAGGGARLTFLDGQSITARPFWTANTYTIPSGPPQYNPPSYADPYSVGGNGHGSDLVAGEVSGSLADYIGTGDIALNLAGGLNTFPGDYYYYGIWSNTTGTITALTGLTYTYDALVTPPAGGVPEPAAWALFIVGFGLVGTRMRRQQPVVAC